MKKLLKKLLKVLLFTIAGIFLLGYAIVENHNYVEKQQHQYRRDSLYPMEIASAKAEKYNWTREQTDSCYVAEKANIKAKKPGFCFYCYLWLLIYQKKYADRD